VPIGFTEAVISLKYDVKCTVNFIIIIIIIVIKETFVVRLLLSKIRT